MCDNSVFISSVMKTQIEHEFEFSNTNTWFFINIHQNKYWLISAAMILYHTLMAVLKESINKTKINTVYDESTINANGVK